MTWLDIDYQLKNRPFGVDAERLPTFDKMTQDLKASTAQHFHTEVITDLHIAARPNIGCKPEPRRGRRPRRGVLADQGTGLELELAY